MHELLAFSRGETKDKVEGSQRRFVETIELQISLRNYDANKDKRFAGAFRLPVPPRPKMTVCMMGTEEHCSQARAIGIDALVRPRCGRAASASAAAAAISSCLAKLVSTGGSARRAEGECEPRPRA